MNSYGIDKKINYDLVTMYMLLKFVFSISKENHVYEFPW